MRECICNYCQFLLQNYFVKSWIWHGQINFVSSCMLESKSKGKRRWWWKKPKIWADKPSHWFLALNSLNSRDKQPSEFLKCEELNQKKQGEKKKGSELIVRIVHQDTRSVLIQQTFQLKLKTLLECQVIGSQHIWHENNIHQYQKLDYPNAAQV